MFLNFSYTQLKSQADIFSTILAGIKTVFLIVNFSPRSKIQLQSNFQA